MLNGIILIDKESGFTSHDVVAKLRGICKQKKIGHTGTLDPDATGVLPVCLGKGTKVSGILTDSDKEYIATFQLGIQTDTQDISGTILKQCEVTCSEEEVKDAISQFLGEISQIPPMYSALKVNGQKLCDLAREGIEVERKERKIIIHEIEILSIKLPYVQIRVACSKGTYIRTLCHDIGNVLSCGACMTELRRTKAAGFTLGDCYTLSQVQAAKDSNELERLLLPIDCVFECYPAVYASEEGMIFAKNGNPLRKKLIQAVDPDVVKEQDGFKIRLYGTYDEFIGIYEYSQRKESFVPYKMFLTE